MEAIKNQTITGLNEHIQELRKKANEIDTTVTLVTFSGPENVNIRCLLRPIKEVETFTDKDYNPNGMTAMYDGVAKLLYSVKNTVTDDDQTNYLVLIISDGQENASKEFNSQKIADLVKELLDTKKWSINYVGANQDLTVVAKDINLGSLGGNTFHYSATLNGTQNMWNTVNDSTKMYRCAVSSATSARVVPASFFVNTTSNSQNPGDSPILPGDAT